MIRKEEVYKIGIFNKPHGIHGELSFTFTDDIFDRVEAEYTYFIYFFFSYHIVLSPCLLPCHFLIFSLFLLQSHSAVLLYSDTPGLSARCYEYG